MNCKGELHLKAHMENLGGEGITLRKSKSLYIPGRPDSFFHLKVCMNEKYGWRGREEERGRRIGEER